MAAAARQPPRAAGGGSSVADAGPAGARRTGPRWLGPAVVALLTLVGLLLRLGVARQSLFADELATYWIVTDHGLGGVVSAVHSNAEITPPLTFVLSWLTVKLGQAPELVRAPAVVAGVVTIPLVYAVGVRTAGRAAALVAAALTAFAPFMVYYSAEARAYGVMMALTVGSTLALLLAVDGRRTRWWVLYGACSCAAMYTHYTAAFLLAAQFVWVVWAHPEARRPALLANLGAAVAFGPWVTGLLNDFSSPTSAILDLLSPFTARTIGTSLVHWSVGFPYANLGVEKIPGVPALLIAGAAVALAAGAAALRGARPRVADRRLVLVLALAASVPVGEAVASIVGTNLFSVRNLAASWPPTALAVAWLVVSAGPRLRWVTGGLLVGSFLIGGLEMQRGTHQRPDYQSATSFVDRRARSGDVVLDETGVLSPGPLTPFDVSTRRRLRVVRAETPEERREPFDTFDTERTRAQALGPAAAAAGPTGRIFFVANVRAVDGRVPTAAELTRLALPGFTRMEAHVYDAFVGGVQVQLYARRP